VVQAAAKLVLEPIFEADWEPCAYGYRPQRSAQDAIGKVHELLCAGYTEVVDADLSKYFDTIPHGELMPSVARRIVDRDVLRRMKQWLKVPVEERDGQGKRRMTGGKNSRCGTPQGGVISPLLANLYMNRFLKYWRTTEQEKALRAHVVNYADDFRDPHPATGRRGAGVDARGDGAPGPDPERSEGQNQGSLAGGFRLSGIHVWRAVLSEERRP
jgi:RNA-directed DNA polymerase